MPQYILGSKCFTRIDLGFIFGSSTETIPKGKEFLKAIADTFIIGQESTRVSVITFNGDAKHQIKLKEHDSEQLFNHAVDAMPMPGTPKELDESLALANREMFLYDNGARAGIPKLLIIIGDYLDMKDRTFQDANALKAKGIKILTVAPTVSYTNAEQIASASRDIFNVDSYDSALMGHTVSSISMDACGRGEFEFYLQLNKHKITNISIRLCS